MRSTSASRQGRDRHADGALREWEIDPFRPRMVGALSADFKAHGELWLNDRRCDMVPVETRGIGILFQDALLFDAFSVGQNLMLALPAHIVGRARRNAVEQAPETAGLANHYTSDPATLSGGERAEGQPVARPSRPAAGIAARRAVQSTG